MKFTLVTLLAFLAATTNVQGLTLSDCRAKSGAQRYKLNDDKTDCVVVEVTERYCKRKAKKGKVTGEGVYVPNADRTACEWVLTQEYCDEKTKKDQLSGHYELSADKRTCVMKH